MAAMYSYLEISGTKLNHSGLFFIPVECSKRDTVGRSLLPVALRICSEVKSKES